MKYITIPKKRQYVEVRIYRHGYRANQVFGFKKYGSKDVALEAAQDWLKEQLAIADAVAPLAKPIEREARKPRAVGNEYWKSMSDKPKPQAVSQILLWGKNKQQRSGNETDV